MTVKGLDTSKHNRYGKTRAVLCGTGKATSTTKEGVCTITDVLESLG